MTRLELAKRITVISVANGKCKKENMKFFCKSLMKGCGAMKPQSKAELQSWYDNLTNV